MAFNKNKALESALKLLSQGKVAQAIGEYQQILRHDAKDQVTLMTVGDLFARQGDMPQAIDYFQRLAQVYLNDGFNSKAIAIYKKIAKLAPAELAPLEKLADLYVQQGVLSEARPLFLQIAEAHLKASRAPKAVEVLNRLLEVEPDNPRVQMRLAELYNVMGQKKEAGQTYFAYAQRLYERNESEEAQKLIDRALEVDSSNLAALLLKAKIYMMAQKSKEAITILESHAEADAGGEVTTLLIELLLKSNQVEKAADRARNQLARGSAHFVMLQGVADALIEGGKASESMPLLRELRDPMIEQGEQDKFLSSLSNATEKLPGETEPLEMLADFCRHTGDPFPLNAALSQLADAYAASGDYARAEAMVQEMIERNKADERLFARLDQLRARAAGAPAPVAVQLQAPQTQVPVPEDAAAEETVSAVEAPVVAEAPIDEDTQRYISQALTDVDLFSSYGLTQKATNLLENVLQRAPRHTPTLERLLDLYLGAGNERRTAELAAQLEQISRERQDTPATERFAELRQRFEKAADLTAEEAAPVVSEPKPPATVVGRRSLESVSTEVLSMEDVVEEPAAGTTLETVLEEFSIAPGVVESAPVVPETAQRESAGELDLSDEWEAMIQEAVEPAPQMQNAQEQVADLDPPVEPESVMVAAENEAAPVMEASETQPVPGDELGEEPGEEPGSETRIEIADETPEAVAAGNEVLDFELSPEPVAAQGKAGAATTEDFLNELAAEIDGFELPVEQVREQMRDQTAPLALPSNGNFAAALIPAEPVATAKTEAETKAENLNELSEVFQEFRNELGELGEEDEDLETHYNLGIAYREMGLLDEAIGEFQKVAKAVQKGKPFRYAMNCSTFLALTFMDKGEPMIASLWYRRALDVPGLELETIIALRYDLAVALEMAGEATSALDSFRQVYAMNIDYRDVADHIAILQKA